MTAAESGPDIPLRTPIDAAHHYLRHGWWPIPLPAGKKGPPPNGTTGWRGRPTTRADLARPDWDWTGNIGIRLPPDVVGIDIDAYHGGSMDALEAKYGKLPPTTWSTSRADGSGIALYRVPVGTTLVTDPAEGIDIIQSHHRYMVCAPSIHPTTGLRYCWIDELADEEVDGPPEPGELPDLPWPWITGLAAVKQAGVAACTPETAQAFIEAHTTALRPPALRGITTRLAGVTRGGRHDALVTTACWAMREAAAGVYSASAAVALLHDWWMQAVADDPHRRDGGEFGSAILWAIGQASGDTERVAQIAAKAAEAPRPEHVDANGEITRVTRFDDDFWTSRPYLDHIRQAARSRLVAPTALLGAVLARIAAFTPPSTCLPALIGSTMPLSTYVALTGDSGAGKSSPEAAAADLVPGPVAGCVGPLALGSGEGLVEAFMELVEEEYETDAGTKKRKVKRQVHHGALFSLDEGQALAEIGSRKGSTILPVLRTAWSGGDPGQANASVETRRHLRPHSYAVGLISLWQPHAAAQLLGDRAGGTPQRFVWMPTDDPEASIDSPPWPGPLEWEQPPFIGSGGIARPSPLEVDDTIVDEIRTARVLHLRRELTIDPLDAHRRLNKLKLAGLLAVLDGRRRITPDDWHLAETVMSVSDSVRMEISEAALAAATAAEMAAHRRAANREIVVSSALQARALEGAAKSITRRVRKAGDAGITLREATLAIAGKHRQHVTVGDALAEAERLRWVRPVGDEESPERRWLPGDSMPTT